MPASSFWGVNTVANGAAGKNAASFPWGTLASASGVWGSRDLSETAPSVTNGGVLASLAQTARQSGWIATFLSRKMAAQTIAAGSWPMEWSGKEGNTAANMFMACAIYVYRDGVGKVATIFDTQVEQGTEFTGSDSTITGAVNGASVTLQDGDRIAWEVWFTCLQSMATSYNFNSQYNNNVVGARWKITAPQTLYFQGESAPANLVVNNATVATTAENVALVQQNTLAVQDAAIASNADNIGLVQQNNLAVQDAAIASSAENVTLGSGAADLVVADSTVATSAENVALTQQNNLAVQDATVASTADNIALTQQNVLAVQDATVASTAEPPTLLQQNTLAVANASIASSAESPTLTQQNVLAVADSTVASTAENVALTQQNTLAVQDASVASTAESPSLTQQNTLAVQDAAVASTAENVSLAQEQTLSVNDATVASTAESPSLVQQNTISVDDVAVAVSADNITLSLQNSLAVDDVLVQSTAEALDLVQQALLEVQDATIVSTAENVELSVGVVEGRITSLAVETASEGDASNAKASLLATEVLIVNQPITFARIADLAVEVAKWSEQELARVADLAVEVMILEGIPDYTGITPEALIEDCTINGIINAAMFQSGIDYKQVTTRGALGAEIVRHRALLLQRMIRIWEGVEIKDLDVVVAPTITLSDVSEVVSVEARRASDQQWERISLVPLDDKDIRVGVGVYVRDNEAVLLNFPTEWGAYDRVRFLGPPVGIVPNDYVGSLYPNLQVAPLFCRALKLHAQGYLEMKAQSIPAATVTRREYVEVVTELLGQVKAQRLAVERRFGGNHG